MVYIAISILTTKSKLNLKKLVISSLRRLRVRISLTVRFFAAHVELAVAVPHEGAVIKERPGPTRWAEPAVRRSVPVVISNSHALGPHSIAVRLAQRQPPTSVAASETQDVTAQIFFEKWNFSEQNLSSREIRINYVWVVRISDLRAEKLPRVLVP